MSITPPDNGTTATTPLYDETIAAPTYDELRVPPPADDVDEGDGGERPVPRRTPPGT